MSKKEDEVKKIEENAEEFEKQNYFLEGLTEMVDDEFSYKIKQRGEDYYESGYVLSCIKIDDTYHAKVMGSDDNIYDVEIFDDFDYLEYDCTCPCEYPCKHIYATMLAIDNGEFKEAILEKYIPKKTISLKELFEKMPAEQLKQLIIEKASNDEIFLDKEDLENDFIQYFPKQGYEYYYNKIYNNLVLENNFDEIMDECLEKINSYIKVGEYSEAIKIIESIIDALYKTNYLTDDICILNLMLKLEVYLRNMYKKGSKDVVSEINDFHKYLKDNNYYNSIYLEDLFIKVL